jgi:hypothetical protein
VFMCDCVCVCVCVCVFVCVCRACGRWRRVGVVVFRTIFLTRCTFIALMIDLNLNPMLINMSSYPPLH